jgi:hypothetical protein
VGEARSNTYLGIAGVLLTVSIGIDVALGIWAESDPALHLWRSVSFLVAFVVFVLVFMSGVYVLLSMFLPLPLLTLMHERDAERELEVRQRYAQLIFEGVCIANDPTLDSDRLQKFTDLAGNFTSSAFPHEGVQSLNRQALEAMGGMTVQTKQEFLRRYLDRMANILDRRAPIRRGFTVADFERLRELMERDPPTT